MLMIFTLAFFTWIIVEKVKEIDEERQKRLLMIEMGNKVNKSWKNIGRN